MNRSLVSARDGRVQKKPLGDEAVGWSVDIRPGNPSNLDGRQMAVGRELTHGGRNGLRLVDRHSPQRLEHRCRQMEAARVDGVPALETFADRADASTNDANLRRVGEIDRSIGPRVDEQSRAVTAKASGLQQREHWLREDMIDHLKEELRMGTRRGRQKRMPVRGVGVRRLDEANVERGADGFDGRPDSRALVPDDDDRFAAAAGLGVRQRVPDQRLPRHLHQWFWNARLGAAEARSKSGGENDSLLRHGRLIVVEAQRAAGNCSVVQTTAAGITSYYLA